MSEFKGSKERLIIQNDFIAVESLDYGIAKVYNNQFISEEMKQSNAELIIEAFEIRQQIPFSLTELKRQRDEMLEVLGRLLRLGEGSYNELKQIIESSKKLNQTKQ